MSFESRLSCSELITQNSQLILICWSVRGYRIFVLIVHLNSEELLHLLCRPHLDGIPRHPLANMHADLASDALIVAHLYVRNDDIYAIRRISRCVLDTIDRAETYAGFTSRTVIRNDHRNFLWLLLFAGDLGGRFRNDHRWIRFFGVVRHDMLIVPRKIPELTIVTASRLC